MKPQMRYLNERNGTYRKAAAQGNENGTELRDLVEKQMTPSQIEKGQELSNEYYKKYVK